MFAIDGDYQLPCHSNPDLFQARTKRKVEAAKRLCATCRVQLICLQKALDFEQLSGESLNGIHGGLTEAERKQTTLTRVS